MTGVFLKTYWDRKWKHQQRRIERDLPVKTHRENTSYTPRRVTKEDAESVLSRHIFFLVIIPQTLQYNHYLLSMHIYLGIEGNLEMI